MTTKVPRKTVQVYAPLYQLFKRASHLLDEQVRTTTEEALVAWIDERGLLERVLMDAQEFDEEFEAVEVEQILVVQRRAEARTKAEAELLNRLEK